MIIEKETSLGNLFFQEIERNVAKKMIIENHYSHKWNTAFGKINIGIIKDQMILGVASFGNLMNPKSYKNISKNFGKDNIVELNRLWIDDKLGKNAESLLIGASWKIIKSLYPNIFAVQSFADGRLGCGTIYKATNFKYYGFSESLFFENIETKEVQHKVPFENTMRPSGMIKLNSLYCQGKLKPFICKTYRYIYPLYKNVKIDLKEEKYPEYEKGFNYIDDYKVSLNNLSRAFILARIFNNQNDAEIIKTYMLENFNKKNVGKVLLENLQNKSILKLKKEKSLESEYRILYDSLYKRFGINLS